MWCGVWCRSVMTKGYNYTAKAIFWIVLVFFFGLFGNADVVVTQIDIHGKKIHHIPQTRFFFRVSQRIFCPEISQKPHLPGGGSPPSRAHHVISPPHRIPALQGVLVDIGLAANALTLGAVPWTLRTLETDGVSDATRETVRGV